ncbi:hypothetical protein AGMMS50267_03300 [Spirochaetia bacterium]|nr:hypothetical protein AGMMS50267_03300 [Spirochaetia bacterium]
MSNVWVLTSFTNGKGLFPYRLFPLPSLPHHQSAMEIHTPGKGGQCGGWPLPETSDLLVC